MMRIVMKWEVGRPVERLREQMKKLHSSQRTESKAGMLEQQLAMTEDTVRRSRQLEQGLNKQRER